MAQTVFQPLGGGSGGDGLSCIDWYAPNTSDLPAEFTANAIGLDSIIFGFDENQFAYGILPIPVSYTSGTQIFLKKGLFHTTPTSGGVLISCTTYIYKASVSGITLPNGYASTNVQQSPGASANLLVTLNNIDLTDSSGKIDSVSVAAGDTLFMRLYRNVSGEASSVQDNVTLLRQSLRAVLS